LVVILVDYYRQKLCMSIWEMPVHVKTKHHVAIYRQDLLTVVKEVKKETTEFAPVVAESAVE
jgi:hypothetical protein